MIEVDLPLIPRIELDKRYKHSRIVYEMTLKSLTEKVFEPIRKAGLRSTIHYRVKSFTSWYAKILRTATAAENNGHISITDVLGIRILCPFLEEVEHVLSLLSDNFLVNELDIKGADYPYQHFGYESIHLLIDIPQAILTGINFPIDVSPPRVCEVQIRTILQDAWAEVEHELVYKSDFTPLDEPLKRKLAALNANLTLSDIMFQEIRDYQKSLHKELQKRRKGFYRCINKKNNLSETNVLEQPERQSERQTSEQVSSQETVDALLLRGLLAHNNKQYSEAIQIYSTILARRVREDIQIVIYIHRGMAYFTAGRKDEAIQDFDNALKLDPDNTKALYFKAVNARIIGEYELAFRLLSICINREPFNLEYLTARGETNMAAGNSKKAMTDFLQVQNIDPGFRPVKRLIRELG